TQAVQVELALDAPVPGPQPVCDIAAYAGTAVAELAVTVQQAAGGVELVADGFAQHNRLVQRLRNGQGQGAGAHRCQAACAVAQRQHGAYGLQEQRMVRSRAQCLAARLLGGQRRLPGRMRQGIADRFEVLEGFHAHGAFSSELGQGPESAPCIPRQSICVWPCHNNPCSAIDRLAPGATMMWSSTRTSTRASALRSVWVSARSAGLAWTAPLGWLWASTTAAAWWRSAC